MVPKPTPSAAKMIAARPLPPLPNLKVRKPNRVEQNPCIGVMASVLGCWASAGYNIKGCAQLEQQLRTCMDQPLARNQRKSNINYHLSRFRPDVLGPDKKK